MHRCVHRRHPAADHNHIPANRHGTVVLRLPQVGDEIHRIAHACLILTRRTQGIYPRQPHAKKHRVIRLLQIAQHHIAPQSLAMFDPYPTDFQQPIHLGLGKILHRLVGCDAVFVQATRLGPRIKHHHIMPVQRQPVRTRQPRRPRPHHRHLFSCCSCPRKRMHAFGHQRIRCKPLQPPDFHRLALCRLAHAGLFAQRFGWADPRAHAPHDVLRQNRLGRRIRRARRDLPYEQRDIDIRRAGRDARRIMAEIAAVRRHPRFMPVKRRFVVSEIRGIGCRCKAVCNDTGGQRAVGQGGLRRRALWLASEEMLPRLQNFIKW